MAHAKPTLPAGHGELVMSPPFSEWAALARANRDESAKWDFAVAGIPVGEMRVLARREALERAAAFSERLGVPVKAPGRPQDMIVATGHQPELYHPGVWIKDFLLQRLAEETGATAVDLVVDSDGFDSVAVSAPCMTPGVQRCRQYLALGGLNATYAFAPVPDARQIDGFCSAGGGMLASLRAPAIRHHFSTFCEQLADAAAQAENLGELVTMARRRYEASAGTNYLELPMSKLARTEAFARFAADIALNAGRFSSDYNAELAEYRSVNKVRSVAQPFPDLVIEPDRVELPLWLLGQGTRSTLWAERLEDGTVRLAGDGIVVAELSADGADAADAIVESGWLVAPKALALTLFMRVFVTDFMIHGIGGGRYDRVTDGVCRRYYGVDPPAFAVASTTMYLPIGAHIVADEEVAAARERLNRLEHNPDALLGDVDFDSAGEHDRALSLAAEKAQLVSAIAAQDADRKAIGLRIREVNTELASLMEPVRRELEAELASLEAQRAASEILTDRTYPFCFWAPAEVADKAR